MGTTIIWPFLNSRRSNHVMHTRPIHAIIYFVAGKHGFMSFLTRLRVAFPVLSMRQPLCAPNAMSLALWSMPTLSLHGLTSVQRAGILYIIKNT